MALTMSDCTLLVPLAVVIIVLSQQKTKTFLLVDAAMELVVSVALIFASSPFTYESLSTLRYDSNHHVLSQFNLCYGLLTPLFYLFCARSAKGEEATQALLATRTFELGLMVFNQCRTPQIFNDKHNVLILAIAMWFCLTAFHLYSNGVILPKSSSNSFINRCIKIDVSLETTFGTLDLFGAAFVTMLVSAPTDLLHVHILKVATAGHLTSALMGVYARGFSNIADTKGYICCRLTLLLMLGGCFAYSVINQRIILSPFDWCVYLAGFVQMVPLLAGLLRCGDEATPSKRD
ncbi:uncharacterized protein [Haliotis cracherodii]|uniref:uncharacterized protein n=1 Tax=Haliotis cracherodii TaxID=6455 RepID=UPI0039E8E2CD